jgi:hypothetical protein
VGLEDWRTDGFNALHLDYMQKKKTWQTKYSVSLSLVCDLQKKGTVAPKF